MVATSIVAVTGAAAGRRDRLDHIFRALLRPLEVNGAARFTQRIVVAVDPAGAGCQVLEHRRRGALPPRLTDTLEEAAALVADRLNSRRDTAVGLRLPAAWVLERRVSLPAAVRPADIARLLSLDLERTTPLRAGDVLMSHESEPATATGRADFRHLVVKRDRVEPLLARLKASGLEPRFVDCWSANGTVPRAVDFLRSGGRGDRDARGMWRRRALVFAVAVLAGSAMAIPPIRQQAALDRLERDVAEVRTRVLAKRAERDRQAADRAHLVAAGTLIATRVSPARLIDELTRILPDHVWLHDVRIDAGTIEAAGMATSAAALLPLIERSLHFTDAAFAAPITSEAADGKERFRIRARLRGGPAPSAEASLARSGPAP